MKEPIAPIPGAWNSLKPQVALPSAARGPLLLALPVLIAVWALGGLYAGLGPGARSPGTDPQRGRAILFGNRRRRSGFRHGISRRRAHRRQRCRAPRAGRHLVNCVHRQLHRAGRTGDHRRCYGAAREPTGDGAGFRHRGHGTCRRRAHRQCVYIILPSTGTNSSATILMILINGLIAGPAVSL